MAAFGRLLLFQPIPQVGRTPRVLTLARVVSPSTCICPLLTLKFPTRPGVPSLASLARDRGLLGISHRAAAPPATAPHCLCLGLGPFRHCRIRPSPTESPRAPGRPRGPEKQKRAQGEAPTWLGPSRERLGEREMRNRLPGVIAARRGAVGASGAQARAQARTQDSPGPGDGSTRRNYSRQGPTNQLPRESLARPSAAVVRPTGPASGVSGLSRRGGRRKSSRGAAPLAVFSSLGVPLIR